MFRQAAKPPVLAALIVLAALSAMTATATRAAFTATDINPDSSWTAASLDLDDGVATATFTVTDAVPGQTASSCTTVTYTGTTNSVSAVKLYIPTYSDADGGGGGTGNAITLADDVDLNVDVFTSSDGSCSTGGSVAQASTAVDTFPVDFASGAALWTPSGGDMARDVQITWTLGSDTADDAQGDGVTAQLVYEVQAGS